MQFKRSGEFTKKEREKFQRNVYLDESSAPMAASIKQKTKTAIFGGLALQFIYSKSSRYAHSGSMADRVT